MGKRERERERENEKQNPVNEIPNPKRKLEVVTDQQEANDKFTDNIKQ